MLSPTDFVALFSTMGGSAYGAVRGTGWPESFSFRLVVGLQTSMVFLIAFACIDYMRTAPNAPQVVPGVKWTAAYMTTALPVVVYLIILAIVTLGIFHIVIYVAVERSYGFIKSPYFSGVSVLLYILLGYHALTIATIPVEMMAL